MTRLSKSLAFLLLLSANAFATSSNLVLRVDTGNCPKDAKSDMFYHVEKITPALQKKGFAVEFVEQKSCGMTFIKKHNIEGVMTDIDILMMADKFLQKDKS